MRYQRAHVKYSTVAGWFPIAGLNREVIVRRISTQYPLHLKS